MIGMSSMRSSIIVLLFVSAPARSTSTLKPKKFNYFIKMKILHITSYDLL